MDYSRAQQILNSEDTIDVQYKGNPVWIESLSQDKGVARVKPLNRQGEVKEVSIGDLVEM